MTEAVRYLWCAPHERLWDRLEDCPCREFPLSACRMVEVTTGNRHRYPTRLDALAEAQPFPPAGGVS